MTVADEIKQKTDIVEVVGQFTKLTKSGKTFRGLCPFHSEKSPSFFVYPEQQSWHCFGACSTGGDVFSFIMKKQGIGFGEALRFLSERTGVPLPTRPEAEADRKGKDRLFQVNEAAAKYFHNLLINSPAGDKARNYLASRGLSLKAITDFQLGYSLNSWDALQQHLTERGYTENELLTAGLIIKAEDGKTHDRFRNKLMFPIFDIRGRVTGFGSRVLDDSLPKYVNSPQTPLFDKSGSLYGINLAQAAIRQQDTGVIVEGYMDVITAHQNGFNNVVAPMGTSVAEKQIAIIKRLTKNLALALDADTAGEEAMLKGIGYENMLEAEVKVILLPSGKDPDDVIKQDADLWKRLIAEALPVIDYTFNIVTAQLDLTTAKGKASAVDKLLPIIAEIKDPVRHAHYLQKLARLVRVNLSSLETALGRLRASKRRFRGAEEKLEAITHPILSSPLEEYALALLFQHPELRASCGDIPPDYFENSENREIFLAYLQTEDVKSIREKLDPAMWEHLDSLITKSLPSNQVEQKFSNCTLRLREKYLRNLEAKKEAVLALEAESRGTGADLEKLKEAGIEPSVQLKEIFDQRRGGRGTEIISVPEVKHV